MKFTGLKYAYLRTISLTVFIALFLLLQSCVDEEIPTFPIIVFNEVQIIPSQGVKFGGSIENVANNKILDYGIVWSESEIAPSLANSIKFSLKQVSAEARKFSQVVSSLKEQSDYSARVYLKTVDNVYYSLAQKFTTATTSKPSIHSVEPVEVNFGDTLSIFGEGFGSDSLNTHVLVENTNVEVLFTSESLVKIKLSYFKDIPVSVFSKDSLSVTVVKYKSLSTNKYIQIVPPKVDHESYREAYSNYDFQIVGIGFNPFHTKAFFDGKSLTITDVTETYLQITAPGLVEADTKKIVITIGNKSATAGTLKVLAPQVINDFSDLKIFYNNTYVITGENLDNSYLNFYLGDRILEKNEVAEKRVVISFPNDICQEEYDLLIKIGDGSEKKLVNKKTIEPSMSDFRISKLDFGAEITLKLAYTPSTNLAFFVSGAQGDYETRRTSETSAKIILPNDFLTEDGWLDIELRTCDFTVVAEAVFLFPKPVIETPDKKFEPYQSIKIEGQYLLGEHVEVYLNDIFITNAYIISSSTPYLLFTMPQHADGNYDLKLKVNGQWSNEEQVEVANTWEKVRSIDDIIPTPTNNVSFNTGGIFTIRDNTLYFSDFYKFGTGKFYSMDLTTRQVTELSKPPLVNGSFTYSDNYGYLNFSSKLYRYDFENDSWDELKSNPYSIATWPYPSSIEGGKLIVFVGGGYFYTFDLATEEWEQHSDGPTDISSSTNYRIIEDKDEAKVYILYFGALFTFDPSTLMTLGSAYLGQSWTVPDVYGYRGIKYDDEVFMMGRNSAINSYKTDGSSWRLLKTPAFSYMLAGDDEYAYIIGESGIWRYNFELAK